MKVDYHIHIFSNLFGNHPPEKYIEQAKEKNLDEIGFSEHFHVKPKYYSMTYEQLQDYIILFRKLKKTTSIPIKLGLEMDFSPGLEEKIKKIIESYQFDFIIGSLHWIGNWEFTNTKFISESKKWDIDELYELYYKMIKQAAKSKLFDIIGHIDIIKIIGVAPKKDIGELLSSTLRLIKKFKLCVEVNTGGLRRPCKEIYPSEKILKIAFDMEVPITLGSDAHRPIDVGADFDKAISLIKKVGYDKIAIFKKRRTRLVELDETKI